MGEPPYEDGAHTQIWNGANEENKLINASYGRPLSNTSVAELWHLTWMSGDTEPTSLLWDFGSGYVRVMPEMQL
jgi:hypothetical protein